MLGSNQAAGSPGYPPDGQHDKDNSPQRTQLPIASPSPPPAAAVSPFRHQRKLRGPIRIRTFEGQHPFTLPPGRTTVEHLILEFHRMACHTLQACKLQRGSPTTGGKAHSKSTHSKGPVSVRDMCMYGPPEHRFLTHPPAHLEINHRPGLPEFLDSRCR